MRERPLLLGACVLAIGTAMTRYAYGEVHTRNPAVAAVLLLGMVLFLLAGIRPWKHLTGILAFVTIVFLCSVFHMKWEIDFKEREFSQIVSGESLKLQGEIYQKEFKNERYTIYLKDCVALVSQQKVACNSVIFYQNADTYSIGETLVLTGKLNRFEQAANEGQFDSRAYYESRGIDFWLDDANVVVADGSCNWYADNLYRFRRNLCAVYEEALGENQGRIYAGTLETMLLGEKGSLDSEVKNLYQSAGISHILAISGLHVSLVGMGIYRFLRRRRFSFGASFAAAFVMLYSYAVMSGNSVSTQRAVGMAFLCMLAGVVGRSYDLLNALGGMVMLLLLENPLILWYSGFQFSVMAILVIGTAATWIQPEYENVFHPTFWEKCIASVYSSVMVWLGTLPLVAFYYFEIPIYAPLLNMLVLPLMSLLFLCGLAGGFIGCISLPVGRLLLIPCRVILNIYDAAASALLHLPKANLIVGKPAPGRVLLFYVLLFFFTWLWRRKRKGHKIRICGLFLLFALLLFPGSRTQEIAVLDVGQGDGTFLRTQEGTCIFVDGGSSSVRNVGTYRILPFLKAKGVSEINYWLVSHGDLDHINGVQEILEAGYPVDYLVVSKWAWDEARQDGLALLLQTAKGTGTQVLTVDSGDAICLKRAKISFLWPAESETMFSDVNDNSLTFLYEDDTFRGMFAGDISAEAEKKILLKGGNLDVDYYKVNHHGSRYSGSDMWLEALSPEIATISCGKRNHYGHPHPEALQRLQDENVQIYRTDEAGQITLRIGKNGKIIVEEFLKQEMVQ